MKLTTNLPTNRQAMRKRRLPASRWPARSSWRAIGVVVRWNDEGNAKHVQDWWVQPNVAPPNIMPRNHQQIENSPFRAPAVSGPASTSLKIGPLHYSAARYAVAAFECCVRGPVGAVPLPLCRFWQVCMPALFPPAVSIAAWIRLTGRRTPWEHQSNVWTIATKRPLGVSASFAPSS